MAWSPAVAKLVVTLAVPSAPTAKVPRTTVPSLKVTVPVGVPAPGARTPTVAVKVTAWPVTAGLTDGASVTAGAAGLTGMAAAAQGLPAEAAGEGGGAPVDGRQLVVADAQRHRKHGLAGGIELRRAQHRGAVEEGDGAGRHPRRGGHGGHQRLALPEHGRRHRRAQRGRRRRGGRRVHLLGEGLRAGGGGGVAVVGGGDGVAARGGRAGGEPRPS